MLIPDNLQHTSCLCFLGNSGNVEREGLAIAEPHAMSDSFGESSGGFFDGCFGTLDGLAI